VIHVQREANSAALYYYFFFVGVVDYLEVILFRSGSSSIQCKCSVIESD
jgi:hypothetical protein